MENTITIRDIINRVNASRDNSVSDKNKTEWLSALDHRIYEDIIKTHEKGADYVFDDCGKDTEELIAPAEFSDMYAYYLFSKIDFEQQELGRFAADNSEFINQYNYYAAWYNRCNMPLNTVRIHKDD